jgi:AcrR family transcriptional regulator
MSVPPKPFYVSATDAPAKQKILIAALHLFVRDGLCETSVRDIARGSGFTNPALFKHFPTKDALARYLFERCYIEMFRLTVRAMNSGKTFAVKQRAVVAAYISALDQDRDAVLFMQDHLRHFWPRMPAAVRKHSILGEVRAMLSAGRRERAVTAQIDLGLLTAAWMGTLQQFARAQYFGEFSQPAHKIAAALDLLLTRMVKR